MLAKYRACFFSAVHEQFSQKWSLLGCFLRYILVIFLYFQVFDQVNALKSQYLYFAFTQLIPIATPLLALEMADEIKRGDLIPFLLRPISYPLYRLISSLGKALVSLAFIILPYIALRIYLGASLDFQRALLSLTLCLLSIFLSLLISMILGLCSIWIREIKSLFWFNFTATFALGGLIVPIHDYSPWMQKIAYLTPYPWILYAPAIFSAGAPFPLSTLFLKLTIWITLSLLCIWALYRRCLQSNILEEV
jgi:ABC-2 type transport system permease protein